ASPSIPVRSAPTAATAAPYDSCSHASSSAWRFVPAPDTRTTSRADMRATLEHCAYCLPHGRSALRVLPGFGRLVLGAGDTATAPGAPQAAFGPGACGGSAPRSPPRGHPYGPPPSRAGGRPWGPPWLREAVPGAGDTATAPGAPHAAFGPGAC